MTALVIFDFDGTLFDTHESIEHTIKLAFDSLLHDQPPEESEVRRLISSGAGLSDTFRALHPDPASFDQREEDRWITEYRRLYAEHGQSLIKAFPGAGELLSQLKTQGIPAAIISNKGVQAVKTALTNNGLVGLVHEALIVGDKTPGATRKPDPGSYTNVVLPALEKHHGLASVDPASVLVVGDTIADIQFAANIGGRACWCRYGYGDVTACAQLNPAYTVDSLAQVSEIVEG